MTDTKQAKAKLDEFFAHCQTMPQYIAVKAMQRQFAKMGYEDNSDNPILQEHIKTSIYGNWTISDVHNIKLKDLFNKYYNLRKKDDIESFLRNAENTKFEYEHEQSYIINVNKDLVDTKKAKKILSQKVKSLESALPNYSVEMMQFGISISSMSLRQVLDETNCTVNPVFDNKQIMDVITTVLSND